MWVMSALDRALFDKCKDSDEREKNNQKQIKQTKSHGFWTAANS